MNNGVRKNLKNFPAHLRADMSQLRRLRQFANSVSAHYGVPVYLCGSALQDDNADPRDWDIRIRLSHKDFVRFFAPDREDFNAVAKQWEQELDSGEYTNLQWRWARECVRRTKAGWDQTKLNIDFQIYPARYWKQFANEPRLRLDTR